MGDITGLQSLDPNIALKAKQIQNMPPDKAISFLLQNGVSSQVAGMVMKNMMMKKAAAAQGQPGQSAPPPKTVSQELDDKVNSLGQQHARGQGLAGLPVNSDMFSGDQPQGMAGGGIVAFDDGGYISGPAEGAPGNISPTDYGAMQQYQIAQAMASQQQQAQAQQAAQAQQQASQAGISGLARGGVVAFDSGGDISQDPENPTYNPLPPSESNAHKLFTGFDRMISNAGGVHDIPAPMDQPGVAPLAAQAPQGPAQGGSAPGAPAPTPPVNFAQSMGIPGPQATQPPKPPGPPQPSMAPNQGASAGMSMRSSGPGGMGPLTGMMQRQQAQLAQQDPEAQGNTAEGILARNTQMASDQGIGAAAQNHLQELEGQKEDIKNMAQQGKWMSLVQAGFAMTTAATQNPHGGFLGALAVGGQKGAEEYGKTIAQYHAQLANVQNQAYQVAQSQENLKYDMSKQAQQEHEKLQDRYDRSLVQMDDTQYKATALVWGRENAAMTARATAQSGYKGTGADMLMRDFLQQNPTATQQEKLDYFKNIQQNTAGVQGAGIRADASQANSTANNQTKLQEARQRLYSNPNYLMLQQQATRAVDPNDQAAVQRQTIAKQNLAHMESQEAGIASPGPAQGGLPPGWSVTRQ